MIPVVTPDEMRAVDAAAPQPVEELISRAGGHVARVALEMLGGSYGRRVVVVAGKGNNGADGREAARRLRRRGVRVSVIDAASAPRRLPPCDLVIDAAYGTGFHGEHLCPEPGEAMVLAVDVPSGIDGLTGSAHGRPVTADVTVCMQALKPGLLLGRGPDHAGEVVVVDLGLDVSSSSIGVVQAHDVAASWPVRPVDAHKWASAVYVCAGSTGMPGAAHLAALGAQRSGAGMVRVATRADVDVATPLEAVGRELPAHGWADTVLAEVGRFGSLVVGPGLGRDETTVSEIRRLLVAAPVPAVVDADALFALGSSKDAAGLLAQRHQPTVLTPHAGEFARLFGSPDGDDLLGETRRLAAEVGAVVALKGPVTVIAEPTGEVRMVTHGDQRLATAGTGDVLAGVVGTALARGADPLEGMAAAAWVHAEAAHHGAPSGLVAGDVADALPEVLSAVVDR